MPPPEVVRLEVGRASRGHFNLVHVPTALKADIYLVGEDPLHRWGFPRRRKERKPPRAHTSARSRRRWRGSCRAERRPALKHSDLDLLVVSDAFADIRWLHLSVRVLEEVPLPFGAELLCCTPEEYVRKVEEFGIVRTATMEGLELLA